MKKIEHIHIDDSSTKTLLLSFNVVFWPLLFTFLITAILGIMDTVMMSRYDPSSVLGVQSILVFSQTIKPIFWAIITGIGIFSVKFIGNDDVGRLRNTFILQIIAALIYGIFAFTVETLCSSQIIGIFIDKAENPQAYQYAKDFARFYRWNLLVYPINLVFIYQYRYENQPKLAFMTSTSLLLINLLLNWVFIFNVGPNGMGATGAGLAALLSNVIFIFVNIAIANIIKMDFVGDFKNGFKIPKDLLKSIAIITLPILISEFLFSAGKYTYSYAFSVADADYFALDRIAYQMLAIPDAFIMAGVTAVSVVIGYELSSGKPKKEIANAGKILFRVMALISLIALLISFIVLPRLTNVYGIPSDYHNDALLFFIHVNGVFILFKGFAYTALFIIRTGGDVRYGVYVDVLTTWLIGIPLLFIGAYLFGLSGEVLKVIQLIDIIAHTFFIIKRYKKYYWLNIVL